MNGSLWIVAVLAAVVSGVPYQEDLIAAVKKNAGDQLLWEPGMNFDPDTPREFFEQLVGNFSIAPQLAAFKETSNCDAKCSSLVKYGDEELPQNFDPRTKWPQCPGIAKVPDQGNCKADYAISTTSAIADRICIATGGKVKTTISAQQVVSCCNNCGAGCRGGIPQEVWFFANRRGIASGGEYKSNEGCQPYLKKPRGFTPNKFYGKADFSTPKCKQVCYNQQYGKSRVREDLHKVSNPDRMCCCGVKDDLYNKGPVTTSMILFEDFLTYKSGIYHHVSGKRLGHISVKVIGYGKENNVDYWLAVNNWSDKWGDKGLFKIAKNKNGAEFEEYLFAGDVQV